MYRLLIWFLLVSFFCFGQKSKKPLVIITDCYHPYQDPGDNLDLIQSFALDDIEPLGIILDITDSFRKDTADHPTLWKDPRGPREAGIIPIEQLSYIFNKRIPYALGPITAMESETDKMSQIPAYQNEGIQLLLDILKKAEEPVEVLSFGSARVLAVAYNREPELFRQKIKLIHLSAGTASKNYAIGKDVGANMIPGGEWNVALDVFGFNRLLKSSLPIALYPCAGIDGGFVMDENNTYFTLHDMRFLKDMRPELQAYLHYAFESLKRHDFLKAMEAGAMYSNGQKIQFETFHVWESSIWLLARELEMVKTKSGRYEVKKKNEVKPSDIVVSNELRPIRITEVRDDGRFTFDYADKSNFSIFYRKDLNESEKALNQIVPEVFKSFR